MKRLLLVVCGLAVGSLATVACGGSAADENSSATEDDLKSSAKSLVGTWGDLDDPNAADIPDYSFTFNADGTYQARGGCRPNPSGPSCSAITSSSGTWKVTKSGPQLGSPRGASEIELVDSFDQKTDYFYSLSNGKLSLSTVFNGQTSVFTKGSGPAAGDSTLTGTWSDLDDANAANILDYAFTFNTDGTFAATGGCRPSGPGATKCGAISRATGSWRIIKSGPQLGAPGGASEIELVDSFGQKSDFFYSITGSKLSLSSTYSGPTSVFTKAK